MNWMIYGANGYTGRLMAEEAARRGLKPILAGRNAAAHRATGEQAGPAARGNSPWTIPRRCAPA